MPSGRAWGESPAAIRSNYLPACDTHCYLVVVQVLEASLGLKAELWMRGEEEGSLSLMVG
jgi:hypothetical protein